MMNRSNKDIEQGVALIRSKLTRHLNTIIVHMSDEVDVMLDEEVCSDGKRASCSMSICVQAYEADLSPQAEWMPMAVVPMSQEFICRSLNRVFVGAPMCMLSTSIS